MRVSAARLAVREVSGHAASLPNPEGSNSLLARVDDRVDLLTAAAAGDLIVLGAQPSSGTEERALHHRPRHPHPPADLGVRQTFQLAEDDDLVVALAQPSESSAQVVQLLAALEGGMWRRGAGLKPAVWPIQLVTRVKRNLLGATGAAKLIDARVAGDLVDPWLERDGSLGRAHPPQRRDEHLLGDVFGPGMVAEHSKDVGHDPPAVARVQLPERPIVAPPHRSDKPVITVDRCYLARP
jgi:hypothetical protein